MKKTKNIMPIAGVLSGALVWGLIWYPYRELQSAGISGSFSTLITYLLAMMCGLIWLPRVWRELPKAGWWSALLIITAGWTNFGYVLAMLHGDVMRVLLLFYLAPLWTILFSFWILKEKLNRYGYLVMVLSLGGAMVMLWQPQQGMPLPQNLSEWLALSAGMAFALSNVVSRRADHLSVETKAYTIWIGTAILTAPLLFWQGGIAQQWMRIDFYYATELLLLGITLFSISFAVQYGISHLPANRAMLLFLFELVVAAAASYWLAGEAMEWRDYLGALLIVSASLLSGKLYSA